MTQHKKTHKDSHLLDRFLQACDAVATRQLPARHSEQTPDCPDLDTFGLGRQQHWSGLYARFALHVQRCSFCRKIEALFQRDESLYSSLKALHWRHCYLIARYIKSFVPSSLSPDELREAYLTTTVRLIQRAQEPDFRIAQLPQEAIWLARAS